MTGPAEGVRDTRQGREMPIAMRRVTPRAGVLRPMIRRLEAADCIPDFGDSVRVDHLNRANIERAAQRTRAGVDPRRLELHFG